ncbi:FxsA cytoplasmic membrane protein [sediment metagenome]|uniref:FxsA cytoplasmic membrane protein n=1 Tax=sediment metagenome TaxID=749907 RepID=D9PIE2_9ZZZZ
MFPYFFILFTILPVIELAVLLKVGAYIGVSNTLLFIILTGITGAILARLEGFATLYKIQQSLREGRMPTEEMLDGVMILIGGILLLTPGFITDIFGFILLIPLSRSLIKFGLRKKFYHMLNGNESVSNQANPDKDYQDFEDAEFH